MFKGNFRNRKINVSIHQSKSGWYYAHDPKKKTYTNMYKSELDLLDDLKNNNEKWFNKEVFFANAVLAVNMA